jgi:hypothetical protein
MGADNRGVDEELDDTVTVPRLPYVPPALPRESDDLDLVDGDLEDTLVPNGRPPRLVEPERRPRVSGPSGVELTADIPVGVLSLPASTPASGIPSLPPEPAPLYFRFRIGRTVVWLDAVCYVGRRPSSPRIVYGKMPRLVRVASPAQEVSSTHIELRQLGASVVATDMRSTNGSVIFPPGGVQTKLRQGESVVVAPGTLVDIGDGNVIEILPLAAWMPSQNQPTPEEGQL